MSYDFSGNSNFCISHHNASFLMVCKFTFTKKLHFHIALGHTEIVR